MKLLTEGNIASIIPKEEEFDQWVERKMTDAKSREDQINRCKEMFQGEEDFKIAMIEISLEEYDRTVEEMSSSLDGFSTDRPDSTIRSSVASFLAQKLIKENKENKIKNAAKRRRKNLKKKFK